MAETFTGLIKVAVAGTLTNSADIGSSSYIVNYSKSYPLTNGTGADMANMIWTDTRTIAASTTEDLDLYGVLTSTFNTTLNFTKIKGIIVSAAAGNTNNVVIGGDANGLAGWIGNVNDVVNVRPGGTFALIANDATAYPVTTSTGDILQIANSSSGTSVTYDILIIGCV